MAEENGLSEREQDILRLVATGASNKEIAQALVISPNTVKVHLRNIFSKIGVVSRTEATLYALRTGLIESPAPPPPDSVGSAVSPTNEALVLPADETTHLPWTRRLRWVGLIAVTLLAVFALVLAGGRALGLPLFFTPTPESTPVNPSTTVGLNRWLNSTEIPIPLNYAASAVYEDNLYLIAGQSNSKASAEVYSFNTVDQAWVTHKPKPNPVWEVQAALLGELIYVPGGLKDNGKPVSQVERYDPRNDAWDNSADLPAPRSAYALAALEGKLYLFGGWDGKVYQNSLFIYDPAEDRWTKGADLPYAVGFASAVSSNGKIFLFGGSTDGKTPLSSVLAYYPQRDLDGEDPWEKQSEIPQARFACGATALGDLIFLFGGSDGSSAPDLPGVQYQPQRDEWSVLDSSLQPIGAGAAALALENYVYVFGSGTLNQRYQAIYTVTIPVIKK
jgi:DNA-binding CsgD family transcriptional regulator/N-acetylneuraminic acid mutarotase